MSPDKKKHPHYDNITSAVLIKKYFKQSNVPTVVEVPIPYTVHCISAHCKHVITFTETWLDGNSDPPPRDGYTFESVNCTTTKNSAGGVGVYISNKLDYDIQKELSLNYKGCEDIWIKIRSKDNKSNKTNSKVDGLVLGAIYRHPTQDLKGFSEKLSKSLHTLNEKKQKYICHSWGHSYRYE